MSGDGSLLQVIQKADGFVTAQIAVTAVVFSRPFVILAPEAVEQVELTSEGYGITSFFQSDALAY